METNITAEEKILNATIQCIEKYGLEETTRKEMKASFRRLLHKLHPLLS